MNPVDLVSSSPWTRVVFTTYALSLSFFEAVILDALLRGRARGALVLSDLEGVRAALSEEGARRVGRDYEISPVVCNRRGVFHPKISLLAREADAHLLVGSGNLTFSGWGGNLEVIEHLHPSFAADAFDDAADFFEAMATSNAVVTTDAAACREAAEDIRKAAERHARTGQVRLLHSLDAPIAEQIARYADDLGGATRIAVASPYFDLDGSGIARLADLTRCDSILLHAHPSGSVSGGAAAPWPFIARRRWEPVAFSHLAGDQRRLHAKTMEVHCRRGRLLLAGSANATTAGLFGDNIEVSVLRVQRDSVVHWQGTAGTPPLRPVADDEGREDAESRSGILHARLDGDTVVGRVLNPYGRGRMLASLRTPLRSLALGEIEADEQGQFRLPGTDLELDSLKTGRLVLRLEAGGKTWEGFISVSVTLELIRRTGAVAWKLIAMMSGMETPEDVAAIFAWFKEDTTRLPSATSVSGGGRDSTKAAQGAIVITRTDLDAARSAPPSALGDESDSQVAWQRVMAMIRSSFAQVRGPWQDAGSGGDDTDEDDAHEMDERTSRDQRSRDKARQHFLGLLDVMLDPAAKGRFAPLALSLAHYMTDRERPARHDVQSWVKRLLSQILEISGPEADMIIATAVLYHSLPHQNSSPGRLRRFLLKRGMDIENMEINASSIPAFIKALNPEVNLAAELERARGVATVGEQIQRYLEAAAGRGPQEGFDGLKVSSHWPRLRRALQNPDDFSRISVVTEATDTCPRKRIRLPSAKRLDLRSHGVAVCDCCGRLILNTDC